LLRISDLYNDKNISSRFSSRLELNFKKANKTKFLFAFFMPLHFTFEGTKIRLS